MSLKSVCVFCGASSGTNPAYREAAVALGRALAQRKLTLVYGGGAGMPPPDLMQLGRFHT